jgi:hypothetical protein
METALLLGDPGPLPFLGHCRAAVQTPRARLWAAGRLFCRGDVVVAHEAVLSLFRTVTSLRERVGADSDRNDLIRAAWESVGEMPAETLGSAQGSDLQLLLVAEDSGGHAIAAVGLRMVYGWIEGELQPLVSPDHPLLCAAGRPSSIPGVLTLDRPVSRILGVPDHLDQELPRDLSLQRDCGWWS